MPLLGKDHLARGRGDIQLFNQVAYTCADLTVQYTSYRLLFSDFGPWCASVFVKYLGITAPSALLDTPLGEARPLQAYLLLGGIALYFAKTLFWNWKFSHSNTLSVFAILLVGIWYYYVLIFSIVLSSYLVNRMPSPVEIALAIIIEPLSLMHEILSIMSSLSSRGPKRRASSLTTVTTRHAATQTTSSISFLLAQLGYFPVRLQSVSHGF